VLQVATTGISVRVPEPLLDWLDEYAKQRGASRTEVIETALVGFREDTERGVPELRRMAREQARNTGRVDDRGVGDCPKRAEGLGHVWAGVKASGDSRNPCRFCGTPGRQARDAQGRPVGEPGFFERATRERMEVLGGLRTPDSISGRKKS
jgi:Arc/MetJ-type ribon-helix-helix transcriptional regulator